MSSHLPFCGWEHSILCLRLLYDVNINLVDVRADVVITTQDNFLVDLVILASSSGMPDPALYLVQEVTVAEGEFCHPGLIRHPPPPVTQVRIPLSKPGPQPYSLVWMF